jgi:hypothetical protein
MSSWQRNGRFGTTCARPAQLLAHQIVLEDRDWFTMHAPGKPHAEARRGQDCGGAIQLHPARRMRMDSIGTFNQFVVERRARKQLFCGVFDHNDRPVFAERGQAFHPQDLQPGDFGRVGEHYEVVISFATKQEAMTYRMMLEGIE